MRWQDFGISCWVSSVCVALSLSAVTPALAQTTIAMASPCETLWYERHRPLAEAGLCFASPFGNSLFGHLTCSVSREADLVLSPQARAEISAARQRELALGCNITTAFPAVPDLRERAFRETRPRSVRTPLPANSRHVEAFVCTSSPRLVPLQSHPHPHEAFRLALIPSGHRVFVIGPDTMRSDWFLVRVTSSQDPWGHGYVLREDLSTVCPLSHHLSAQPSWERPLNPPVRPSLRITLDLDLGERPALRVIERSPPLRPVTPPVVNVPVLPDPVPAWRFPWRSDLSVPLADVETLRRMDTEDMSRFARNMGARQGERGWTWDPECRSCEAQMESLLREFRERRAILSRM